MTFESNEFSDEALVERLMEKCGHKKNGKPFTKNDVAQYQIKGQLPRFYGGNKISTTKKFGVKVNVVEGEF
jgi:hypothetical protein